MKKKIVVSVLALLGGVFGVHRFYLNQQVRGIAHFLFGAFGVFILTVENTPFVLMFAFLIAVIDAVLFFAMPQSDFDNKYNRKPAYTAPKGKEQYRMPKKNKDYHYQQPKTQKIQSNPHRKSGVAKYSEYDFKGAIKDFEKSLEINLADPRVHFYLAASHSMTENANKSIHHLGKAVEYGFNDFDKIETYDALAFLRIQDEYDNFKANGYKLVSQIEAPTKQAMDLDDVTLSKIQRLGELREKGFITEEEFAIQKKRLLE